MQQRSWLSYAHLVWTIGWTDFVRKYRGSVWSYFFSFGRTLLWFLVIGHVVKGALGQEVPYYGFYLFFGIIVWEFFTGTVRDSMNIVFRKRGIIERVPLPRILFPLSSGITNTMIFGSRFLLATPFLLFWGPPLSSDAWYVVITSVQILLVSLGIGMALGAFVLRYRDLPQVWGMCVQILFWLTPIIYAYETNAPLSRALLHVPEKLGTPALGTVFDLFIRFQPLSVLLHDFRRPLLYADTVGTPTFIHAMAVSIVCSFVFFCGLFLFRYRSGRFLEEY